MVRMLRRPAWLCPALLLLLFVAPAARSAERALWLRYPAMSPDGRTIVFGYQGNLWKVAVTGGLATPLTVGDAYNSRPVWSPEGSKIAQRLALSKLPTKCLMGLANVDAAFVTEAGQIAARP